MAITTLATLKTALANWIRRDDLTPYLEDLIQMGEKYLWRHVRIPAMETTGFSEAISSGTVNVPTGFLGWKWAALSGNPNRFLKVRPAQWVIENYPLRSSSAKPWYIARDGSTFIFGPYPDSSYTVVGTYWAQPTTVLASPNAVFTDNPDAYLFACLSELEAFVKNDKRVGMWMTKRDQIIRDMNNEGKESERDSTMATTPDFVT